MSLYRGAGGASDATDDSTVNAVAGYASAAASSASSAATSATNASNSASAAASSASGAASSASSVATNATNAASSASLASTYAANASASKDAAAASAATASTKAGEATSSASSAAADASTATTKAAEAAASALAADGSADDAAASAADALAIYGSTAAVNAAVASAAASAVTASTQAGYSSDSASESAASAVLSYEYSQNSAEWASFAQGSANSAAASASSALAIYGNTSAMNQAVQTSTANAAQAVTSANAAAASASSAATSATTATTQAANAATSAAQASAVALGNEPVRHSVRPSLLLDFANTKALDPRITFTRASTATYYGTHTAKAEENLLIRSQEFNDGAWPKTALTVTANTATAPDGTSTADSLIEDTTTAQRFLSYTPQPSLTAGTSYAYSCFAKNIDGVYLVLSIRGANNNYASATFNLNTGAVASSAALGSGFSVASTSITDVGNGWYRCVLNLVIGSTLSSPGIYMGMWDGVAGISTSGLYSYTGTSKSIYIWGAQLEQRSSVTAYTPTTTAAITNYIPALQTAAAGVARFDHNPTTGESLGLLIEEQRTNLLVRSEEFDNASWTKYLTTVSPNIAVAPDGTLTADKLAAGSTSTGHTVEQAVTLSANTAYTASVYLKAGEYGFAYIFVKGTGAGQYQMFNLSTGALAVSGGGTRTATITSVGNGWYRCTVTVTTGASVGSNVIEIAYSPTDSINPYVGNGWNGIYIWGAQLEAGSFATSYIPTVASQVTRSADAASMTGTNFSSWYRADEGTLYGEAASATVSGYRYIAAIRNAGATDSNNIGFFGASGLLYSKASNVDYVVLTSGTVTANSFAKVSGAYKVNDFALSTNGGTSATDTAGLVPVVDQMFIGNFTGSNILNGPIKKIAYYPKRLTNAELQGLTTV